MTDNLPVGRHILLDLYGAKRLACPDLVRQALLDAAIACGATPLSDHIHDFGEGEGVTGVIILAESHISIHTWPEFGFAAVDVFMCGKASPHLARSILEKCFEPSRIIESSHSRGGFGSLIGAVKPDS